VKDVFSRQMMEARYRIRIITAFKWQLVLCLLASAIVFIPLRKSSPPAFASSSGAAELISLVNQLRTSRGLAPYKVDGALMAAAQAQSDYQASIGSVTHTGLGGSTPHDRAAVAGYSGGSFFISENIIGGRNFTAEKAVQAWQGDSLHLGTMLNPNARNVGAGVATVGDYVYMTLDAGYKASDGYAAPPATGPAPGPVGGTPASTSALVMPVVTATAQPDGSVIHVVEPGQVLINIAAAYGIKLSELLALNGLTTTSVIYPGEKLIIKRASMTVTLDFTPTRTAGTPTLTQTTTSTSTQDESTPLASSLQTQPVVTPSPTSVTPLAARAGSDPLLIAIGVLVVLGTLLVIVGFVLKQRS
jgi:uncharacterized protein YkwD/LysM repeat protein